MLGVLIRRIVIHWHLYWASQFLYHGVYRPKTLNRVYIRFKDCSIMWGPWERQREPMHTYVYIKICVYAYIYIVYDLRSTDV